MNMDTSFSLLEKRFINMEILEADWHLWCWVELGGIGVNFLFSFWIQILVFITYYRCDNLFYLLIIFYWLYCYSCPNFSQLSLYTSLPSLPPAICPALFMSMGHAYTFFGNSISYTCLLTYPCLFCTCQFVLLNPFTFYPILTKLCLNWWWSKCFPYL